MRLLPMPTDPLVYCSTFDNEYVDLNVSPDDVEVLIHHEAFNDDVEEMIEINGLSFCKDHRLENCGTCGFEFRIQNLKTEMGDFEGNDEAAQELDRALDEFNYPQRHAPGSKVYRPVVTAAIEVLPAELDPSTLAIFSPDEVIRIAEANDGDVDKVPPDEIMREPLPLERARKTIATIIEYAAELLQQRTDPESTISIALRDEAKSEVLRLEIVEPIWSIVVIPKTLGGDDDEASAAPPVPMIVVRWFHTRCSNQAAASQPQATMRVASRLDDMALLAEILKSNASQLVPSFVFQTKTVAPFALSALTIIPDQCEATYYQQLGDHCHRCGTSGTKMFRCSQCKAVKFCSRVCQKKNWKFHKNECSLVTS